MNQFRTTVFGTLGLAIAALAAAGCLERKETIRVHRDGAVELLTKLDGDKADYDGGDALPTEETGWKVQDEVEKDGDKEKLKRDARMKVVAGRPLPDSYAKPGSEEYEISLRFPTEVTIERRPDGTYYHFVRTYEAREQARYTTIQKLMEQDQGLKELSAKKPEELTDDDRLKLVTALRDAEMLKQAEFLRLGYESMKKHWPQHYYLLARQALMDAFQQVDLAVFVALLSEPESPERDRDIQTLSNEWLGRANTAVFDKLTELRVPQREIEGYLAAVNLEEKRRGVTEDIGDETWEVRLSLPGELVAHNGHKVEDGEVIWQFHAEAMMDRDMELMATSRVTRDGGQP